jgi:hypothetical protein
VVFERAVYKWQGQVAKPETRHFNFFFVSPEESIGQSGIPAADSRLRLPAWHADQ